MVCTQWQAGDGTPVAKGQPLVKVESRHCEILAPSVGPAIASGLTKPSTGRFCLREKSGFGLAKSPSSFASACTTLCFACEGRGRARLSALR